MMYVLMPSPVFLEYNDVRIYEVYKDDIEGIKQNLMQMIDKGLLTNLKYADLQKPRWI